MTTELLTDRLRLVALTKVQLALFLEDLERLESELGFPISPENLNAVVRRAIELKLAKMAEVEPHLHPWYTYWLIVVRAAHTGAGLAGFKGTPDQGGEVEIGYGIAPDYRNRGYMTEAVRALIAWAFGEAACQAVFADPRQGNVASQRVLAKAGMVLDEETPDVQLWRIDRASWYVGRGDGYGNDQTGETQRR